MVPPLFGEDADQLPQRKGEAIYTTLKRQLLRGDQELGASLSVADLAVALGASRQPVMEALKRLQAEGFVEIIPQVGCRVVTPTASEVSDFYEVFGTMEGLASRLAAERRDPEEMEELHHLVGRLSTASEGGNFDPARYAAANRAFHGMIHRIARSREARAAAETYWDRSDFLIASTRPPFWGSNIDRAEGEHEALFEAIAAGKGARAQKIAFDHIRSFGDAVLDHLLEIDGART